MKKELVLIVDDEEINRIMLNAMLEEEYDLIEATDGEGALDILFNQKIIPSAILLDIIMPGIDGFQVLEELKNHPETEKLPVLFISASDPSMNNESRGLKAGAADYVPKPFNADVIKARLESHISLTDYQAHLEEMVEIKTSELTRTYEQTLEVLATFVEYRSLESGEHIKRTSKLSEILINQMMSSPKYGSYQTVLSTEIAHAIVRATALHDIGKIGITDLILCKKGRLTDDEFEIMKQHTVIGSQIVDMITECLGNNADYLTYCREICYYHHERWDGRGYPSGIAGDEIPLSARILSIVDVYDALVNQRVYKPAFSHDEAVNIIVEGKGTQFDPVLVEVFLDVVNEIHELELSLQD
ncbi:MAG: response regulator [Oscillospiraceae bacterium]|jgi:putative two-component system response regulator|nr:response regulator [Oscillospiraceae bacterium]